MPAAEMTDEPPVIALSPDRIAQDRAAADARSAKLPDGPMDAAESDVVMHPSHSFNDMASKLDKAMKEVGKKESTSPPLDTGPVDDKKQTDSKHKPKAEDAKQADDKTAENVDDKTITSAKAADWKVLKQQRDDAQKQRDEFKQKHELTTKEYEEFRKRAVDSGEVEKVKAEMKSVVEERAKLQEQLETVALERSEKFSKFYENKFTESSARAKDAVGTENAERISQLMALPPSKWRKDAINEIRETLAGVDQGQLDIAIAEHDHARNDRDTQLKNSKENYKRLQDLESEKALTEKQQREKRSEAVLASVLSFARDNFESFKTGEDKAHNEEIPQHEEFLERFFKGKMAENEIATLPLLALEAKRLASKVVPSQTKKIAELEAALKEYQGVNPPANGGAPRGASGTSNKEKSFAEVFQEQWPQGNR